MSSSKAEYREIKNGYIPKEWKEKKIEETNLKIIDGDRGKNYPKKSELLNYGYCVFLNNKNLLNDKISLGKSDYISKKRDSVLKKGKAKINDIILTTRGSVGNVGLLHEKLGINFLRINSGMIIIRNNDKFIYTKFLYQILKSPFLKRQYEYMSTGSVQRQLPIRDIRKLKLLIPPLIEQEQIASILSSLDDKIELNNQINKNLEEITQAIFKHWFVDFEFPNENGEPYKSSGGEMLDSELGPIPKGWEIANFNAFVNEISNGDWGKASALDNYEKKVYCMRGADIPEICEGRKGKMPIRYVLEKNLNKKVLCAGNLVIEISGGSPTQSTGRTTYINQEILSRYDTKLICSNFCKVIKLINKDYCEYLFLYLRYLYELNIFFNFENGTTGIKNLDIKNLFEKYKIKVPDEFTIIKFRKIIRGIFRKIQENGYKNNKLSSLRDILLPKLMSGEIRVPINSKVLISKNN